MKRHEHQWDERGRTYIPPTDRVARASNLTVELMEKLTYGLTNVELVCRICGDVKIVSAVGKVQAP